MYKQWAGPKFHSLLSTHPLIGAYFLTTESNKRMRLLTRLYCISQLPILSSPSSQDRNHLFANGAERVCTKESLEGERKHLQEAFEDPPALVKKTLSKHSRHQDPDDEARGQATPTKAPSCASRITKLNEALTGHRKSSRSPQAIPQKPHSFHKTKMHTPSQLFHHTIHPRVYLISSLGGATPSPHNLTHFTPSLPFF